MKLILFCFLLSLANAISPYYKIREFLGLERRDSSYFVYTIGGEVFSIPTAYYGIYGTNLKIYTTDGYVVYSYFGQMYSFPTSYYAFGSDNIFLSDFGSVDFSIPSLTGDLGTATDNSQPTTGGSVNSVSQTASAGSGGSGTSATSTSTGATNSGTTTGGNSGTTSHTTGTTSAVSTSSSSEKSSSSSKASASPSPASSTKNLANSQTANTVAIPVILVFSILFM